MKWAVVIPTHNPGGIFYDWLDSWTAIFTEHDIKLFVVDDSTDSHISLPDIGFETVIYTRKDYPDYIKAAGGSCRSIGLLKAYQEGYDVVTLDHDCFPMGDIFKHYEEAFDKLWPVSDYFDIGHVFGMGEFMRGYPFSQRLVAKPLIQYGGWDNVPDLDAITQQGHEKYEKVAGYKFDRKVLAAPKGLAVTGCAMNVAMKNEAIPLLYQLVMGMEHVGYDRWDDILSGLFAKKICDHLNIPILINGKASIFHERASDSATNLIKEKASYPLNEVAWDRLNTIKLESKDIVSCYAELIPQLKPEWFGPEGHKIIKGMAEWLNALS